MSYNVITFTTCKSLISKQVTTTWQQCWDRSVCARTTYKMVPSVGSKIIFPKNRCIAISYARLLLNDTTLRAHQYHTGLAETKVCECNQGVEMYITSSFSVHTTQMLGSSCCSLCKNRGPTLDVKDRHTSLSLFFWLRPTWASSVQNKVMTLCSQRLIILDRRGRRL